MSGEEVALPFEANANDGAWSIDFHNNNNSNNTTTILLKFQSLYGVALKTR